MKSLYKIQKNLKIKKWYFVLFILVSFFSSLSFQGLSQTPVAANGKLSVVNGQLINSYGNPVQLRGMSTHGLQWYASCINYNAISTMVSTWGVDVLRLAMYVEEDGYVTDPDYYKSFIDELVDLSGQFGIYCIIDWHVHNPGDPWTDIDAAREFWSYMSSKHSGKAHVLYEICNEPNGVDWSRVKSYAEDIIPIIRANDPNTVVIVGTPNWSQDVDVASQDPLSFDNVMYTLHFYSGSHGQALRDKANIALTNGIGIFVTEWGTSQASGDGGPYLTPESDDWISWMNNNSISWCNWSYSDKDEVSAALISGSCLGGDWSSTSQSGEYVKSNLLNPADSWAGGENIPPVGTIVSPDNNAKFELDKVVTITANASDQNGTVSLVEFYANGVKIGEDNSLPYSFDWTAGSLGDIELSIRITDNEGLSNTSSVVTIEILDKIVQYAYPDSIPHPIEGSIQGIYYDVGGEGIAYHDADGTNKGGASRIDEGVDTEGSDGGNVGYTVNGEWLEYTVNVATPGDYKMDIRVASESGGGQFHLDFDGTDKTGVVDVPSTGSWTSYQTLTVQNIPLEAGEQVMRMAIDIGDFNFSSMTFAYTGVAIDPTGITLSPDVAELESGATVALTATVLPAGATNKSISWASSDASIASVNSSGVVTGVSEGTATITATTVFGGFSDTCVVTVLPGNNTYILTINTEGQGSVTLNPEGGVYEPGITVALTAVPDSGNLFSEWGGDASGTNPSISVVMDGDKTISALFKAGISGCDGDTLIDIPFTFEGAGEYCWVASGNIEYVNSWNLDLLEVNGVDCTNEWSDGILPDQEGNYSIHYVSSVAWGHVEITGTTTTSEPHLYTLTASVTGNGSVSVNPFAESYEAGSNVEVTAISGDGYYLESWSGDVSGTTETITLVMDENKSVIANFSQTSVTMYTLSVEVIGQGTITPGGGSFEEGAVIILSALPAADFSFNGWTGDAVSDSSSIEITMNADVSLTATFLESVVPVCESVESINVPFTQNGVGEYCWLTSDDIAYVNSWNMEEVSINGIDYTNTWSEDLPAKQDGNYNIYYKALYSWGHLEVAGAKSTDGFADAGNMQINVYPNPFVETTTLVIEDLDQIDQVVVYDQFGKIIRFYSKTEITNAIKLGDNLTKGIYILKVSCISTEKTFIMNKLD